MDENRFLEAIPPLKQAINLNPKNTDAHFSLGLVYDNLNSYQEAQNQYRQVLQIDPKHFLSYQNSQWKFLLRVTTLDKLITIGQPTDEY